MLPYLIEELKTRQAWGDLMAEQMCERLDAHIRDMEQSKAWIRSNAMADHDAIDRLLGITPSSETTTSDPEPSADTFQTDPYEVEGGDSQIKLRPGNYIPSQL